MFVHNLDTITRFWVGQGVAPGAYYEIQIFEQERWANDSALLKDMGNAIARMARDNTGSTDIIDFNEQINFLKERPTPILVDHTETHFKQVASESEEISTGIVIPNGELVGIKRFKGVGLGPASWTALVWDRGGVNEKIFGIIQTSDEINYDISLAANQVTGDGVKTLQVLLTNDTQQSAALGGLFEAVTL